jgi:4-oxalocrotonate tautomerase
MPLINVKLVEGVFDAATKQRIVRELTEVMMAIEGENMRPVTWVLVEELKSGDRGIAGNPSPPPTSRRWPPAAGRLREARTSRRRARVRGPAGCPPARLHRRPPSAISSIDTSTFDTTGRGRRWGGDHRDLGRGGH